MILVDGVEYQEYYPESEEEFEQYVEGQSRNIFGEDILDLSRYYLFEF